MENVIREIASEMRKFWIMIMLLFGCMIFVSFILSSLYQNLNKRIKKLERIHPDKKKI